LLSAADPSPGSLASAGRVGLSADNSHFHFDDFQVIDLNAGSTAAAVKPCAPCRVEREEADPTFVFRDLFVFPNPAREGAAPTIHFAAGVGDSVKIRIFDIAGTEVHGAILDQRPAVIRYEGKLRYAYEFPWRGHIPSGVYLYSIEAEKQGHPSIRKTGRFAVVR
jgi:hypothetical protein